MTARIPSATIGKAWFVLGLMAVAQLLLAGCSGGSVQQALGLGKRSPDEFAVVSRAPLIVPPDFDLRPPRPGEPRPQVGTAGDQARAQLLEQSVAPAPASPAAATAGSRAEPGNPVSSATPASSAGQQALLQEAGAGAVDPAVRQRIAAENQSLAAVEGELFTRLLAWREPVTLGATVDAPAEAERLIANRTEGQSPTAGDTPSVVERRQSPLGVLVDKVF